MQPSKVPIDQLKLTAREQLRRAQTVRSPPAARSAPRTRPETSLAARALQCSLQSRIGDSRARASSASLPLHPLVLCPAPPHPAAPSRAVVEERARVGECCLRLDSCGPVGFEFPVVYRINTTNFNVWSIPGLSEGEWSFKKQGSCSVIHLDFYYLTKKYQVNDGSD